MNSYGMRAVWLSLAGLAGIVLLAHDARAYDPTQHVQVAERAMQLYVKECPGREPWLYRDWIYVGAADEDSIDHVFGYSAPLGQGVTRTHFWDVDEGILDQVTLAGLTGSCENAFQKVTGVGTSSGWGLWQQAVAYYQLGDKPNAYERLGHISHLIADMSVPAHTHEDAHNPDHYEATMNQYMVLTLPLLDQRQMDQGLLTIPEVIPPECQSLGDFFPLFYLMYSTNQRADFFASAPPGEPWAGYAGDAATYTPWLNYTTWETQMAYYMDPHYVDTPLFYCQGCGALGSIGGSAWPCTHCGIWMTPVDPSIIIAMRYTLVHGVRATATFMDYWEQTVVPEPATMGLLAAGMLALIRLRRVTRRG